MIDTLRIERTNLAPAGKPPLYKVRLITNRGDVLIPSQEQLATALALMALFDPPAAKDETSPPTSSPA